MHKGGLSMVWELQFWQNVLQPPALLKVAIIAANAVDCCRHLDSFSWQQCGKKICFVVLAPATCM